jgi:hypothetical protein
MLIVDNSTFFSLDTDKAAKKADKAKAPMAIRQTIQRQV